MHCLTGQNGTALIVDEDANECTAVQLWLDGKSFSPVGCNKIPGTPLKKVGSDYLWIMS